MQALKPTPGGAPPATCSHSWKAVLHAAGPPQSNVDPPVATAPSPPVLDAGAPGGQGQHAIDPPPGPEGRTRQPDGGVGHGPGPGPPQATAYSSALQRFWQVG